MAKLIKLPGGKYIKADAVISVGELWKDDDNWSYSICYSDNEKLPAFHVVDLNSLFVHDETTALKKQSNFVDQINNNL